MNCIICNSINIKTIHELYDDRYGYQGNFNLLKCSDCCHIFVDHHFTSGELSDLYSNYYPRANMKVEDYDELKYKRGFNSWLNGENRSAYTYVPKNVKVLDIGCGFGQSLGYHRNRGCEVYGVEADENIKRVVDIFGFNVKIGLFDASDYEHNFFDFVTMDQVIEHVTNPLDVLSGIYSILKPNGYVILSTPNSHGWGSWVFNKYWINWHTPYHINLFSKYSIKIALEKSGFQNIQIKTITSSEWLNYQWFHFLFYPKLNEPSYFWNENKKSFKKIGYFKKAFMIFLYLFQKTKINHIITRIFDSVGFGDNILVIAEKK